MTQIAEKIHNVLKEHNTFVHTNEGITICVVPTLFEGVRLTKDVLYTLVDKKTVLYLSGGSLKSLYEGLSREGKIIPGAVGLVDERYGEPFHAKSNEKMIESTGFLFYLHTRGIPFYSVLHKRKSRNESAEEYDEQVRSNHAVFQKNVALLGIGLDGHISSVIPNRPDFINPWFQDRKKQLLVSEFDDPKSEYGERIGMTFLGLAMLDIIVVFVFGETKARALLELFRPGKEEDLPARFFKRPEIAKKTLFITDQQI